jgi:hypothetical protein
VGIITTALRCSAYLAILFNWDKHTIFCGRMSLFKSKNLVLETAYSIAYRIQDLIKLVEYEVHEALRNPGSISDPATISCALWILYRSIRSQHKVHWRASSLKSLVFPHSHPILEPQLTFSSKNFWTLSIAAFQLRWKLWNATAPTLQFGDVVRKVETWKSFCLS